MPSSIARDPALESLRTLDQLDRGLIVTRRASWISLAVVAALLAGASAWATLGTIRVRVDATGVWNQPAGADPIVEASALWRDAPWLRVGQPVRIAPDGAETLSAGAGGAFRGVIDAIEPVPVLAPRQAPRIRLRLTPAVADAGVGFEWDGPAYRRPTMAHGVPVRVRIEVATSAPIDALWGRPAPGLPESGASAP